MTEEQKNEPAPRNAAQRVTLIVERLRQGRTGTTMLGFYEQMLEEEEFIRLIPKIPLLLRPFQQVLAFIDASPIKGLTDRDGCLGKVLQNLQEPLQDPRQMAVPCQQVLQGVNLDVLAFTLDICAKNMGEEEDTSEEIRRILKDLDLVRGEIEVAADLDEKVREFCLERIDALERALRVGELLGGESIEAEMWDMAQNTSKFPKKSQARFPEKYRELVKQAVIYADKFATSGRINALAKLIDMAGR